jgi:hypothetical protein
MKLSAEVRATHGQDGAVVLHIRQGQMFRLNLVGSRILELLSSGLTESEIADKVSGEFGADRATVIRDLAEFLALLRNHQLIEMRQSEAGTTA